MSGWGQGEGDRACRAGPGRGRTTPRGVARSPGPPTRQPGSTPRPTKLSASGCDRPQAGGRVAGRQGAGGSWGAPRQTLRCSRWGAQAQGGALCLRPHRSGPQSPEGIWGGGLSQENLGRGAERGSRTLGAPGGTAQQGLPPTPYCPGHPQPPDPRTDVVFFFAGDGIAADLTILDGRQIPGEGGNREESARGLGCGPEGKAPGQVGSAAPVWTAPRADSCWGAAWGSAEQGEGREKPPNSHFLNQLLFIQGSGEVSLISQD